MEWNKSLFCAGIVCIGVVLQSLHYSERVPCKTNLEKMRHLVLFIEQNLEYKVVYLINFMYSQWSIVAEV